MARVQGRGWRLVACGLLAMLVLVLWGTARANASGAYVALGDSFTSGPLVPFPTGKPLGCGRSTKNYPHRVARAIDAPYFRDVSCGSAQTDHMTEPQEVPLGSDLQTAPPQFNGLSRRVKLVTVGIGGNDIGLTGVAEDCLSPFPTGSTCRDEYTDEGDEIGERIAETAGKVTRVLRGIHRLAPRARVLLVGYPVGVDPQGDGCWPLIPVSPIDAAWFDLQMRRTNHMLSVVATENDAEYVDVYTSSLGHDACKPPAIHWIEGIVPTSPAFPFHPNAQGTANQARQVLKTLGHPVP